MKTLLKILLISISLYGCSGSNDNKSDGSGAIAISPDSVLHSDNTNTNMPDPAEVEKEKETTLRINEALLSSKREIIRLRSEVSDSLTMSDLSPQKRSLFSKTIQQLEASSDLINKQLEEILVGDLQTSREKLNEIVKKMKGSEREMGAMVQRLDKITGYMQLATTLMQTLLPIPKGSAAAPVKNSKETPK
jgi:hypothetical protein